MSSDSAAVKTKEMKGGGGEVATMRRMKTSPLQQMQRELPSSSAAPLGYRKLDFGHGFIKQIIRNQVIRDEYHKVMEERSSAVRAAIDASAKSSPGNVVVGCERAAREQVARKKQLDVYVPPHMRRAESAKIEQSKETNRNTPQIVNAAASTEKDGDNLKSPTYAPVADIISRVEDSKLREKVRKNVLAKMNSVEELCSRLTAQKLNNSPEAEQKGRRQVETAFILKIRQDDGTNAEIIVKNTDNPARLAKSLARQHNYTDLQVRTLRLKLEKEFEERHIALF